ncbi:MAG TPA: hypothetical protein VJ576_03395 [Rhodocyclaceae bacterium]|nr:hypothetical protein [Rhodocyclaceae bacterium]
MAKLTIAIALLCPLAAYAAGALSPEVTQDNTHQTICQPGYTATVRPPRSYTDKVKRALMREAGIDEGLIAEYELDHIIPLALGGHPRKAENLRLQPWEGEGGAKRKDRIEVKLQCLVCSGQVALADAQREVAGDWQGACHRYSRPKCRR